MSPARITVRAVVVAHGDAPHLPDVLAALDAQETRPDSISVICLDGATVADPPQGLALTIETSEAATWRDAVVAHLDDSRPLPGEYLWLLHDDTAPRPDALQRLLAVARQRRRAGVIGAAITEWDEERRILNLGSTVTRTGSRRLDLPGVGELDQGQYDGRDDVLAVSLAGALVDRDVWRELDGTDPAYARFGSSVEFCRRVWRIGRDVVIVPDAMVRHRRESFVGSRASGTAATYVARRASEWQHSLSWSPVLAWPFLALWGLIDALVRSLFRIARNEPRLIPAEFAVPWAVVALLPSVASSRRLVARASSNSSRADLELLASWSDVLSHARRALRAEDGEELIDISDETRALAGRRRRALLVVILASVGLSLAAFWPWLAALGADAMLTSTATGATNLTFPELWARATTGWDDTAFGVAALDGAFAGAMLPLSLVPGGLATGLAGLMLAAPLLAAVGAWAAVGAVTRRPWVRVGAALLYAVWAPFLVSLESGAVSAVVVHALVGWAAFALLRGSGWHVVRADTGRLRPEPASPSARAGFGVLAAVAVAVQPALILIVAPAVVVLAIAVRGARFGWLLAGLPALAIALPGLDAAYRSRDTVAQAWALLVRDSGPAVDAEAVAPWRLALGDVGQGIGGLPSFVGSSADAVTLGVGAVVAAAALASLISLRSTRVAVPAVLVAAGALVLAVAQTRTVTAPADVTGAAAAHGWPGASLSVLVIALLLAAASATVQRAAPDPAPAADGADETPRSGAARTAAGLGRAVAGVLVAAALVAAAGQAVVAAWPDRVPYGDVAVASARVLPLVTSLEVSGDAAPRVLYLSQGDAGVTYSVMTRDGQTSMLGRIGADAAGTPVARGAAAGWSPETVGPVVAGLVGGSATAVDELAELGIGIVVVDPDSVSLAADIDSTAELSLIGASESGSAWRVSREVSRAWLDAVDGRIPLGYADAAASGPISGAGTVVVTSPASSGWQGQLSGRALTAVDSDRVEFVVSGEGEIAVQYVDPSARVWWWTVLALLAIGALAAVPLRRSREGRRA